MKFERIISERIIAIHHSLCQLPIYSEKNITFGVLEKKSLLFAKCRCISPNIRRLELDYADV